MFFHQFISRAEKKGLQYLGEADFSVMSVNNFSPEVAQKLQSLSSDTVQMEQYMDFVRNRMFRQTLLCHRDVPLDRKPGPERVYHMSIASNSAPEKPIEDFHSNEKVTFKRPGSTLTTRDPLTKAAMTHLLESWPRSVPFRELLSRARARLNPDPVILDTDRDHRDARGLAEPLLRCYATGHVDFTIAPIKPLLEVTSHPLATPLVRHQAAKGKMVTSVWHQAVELSDFHRYLIQRLDGQRDHESLMHDLFEEVRQGKLMVHEKGEPVQGDERLQPIVSKILSDALQWAAKRGLLSGNGQSQSSPNNGV
jgi:methyltransferase-like protein